MPPFLKIALDLAPLGAFFVGYKAFGLQGATAAIIAVTAVSLSLTYAMERRISLSPLITGMVVAVLGGLTLYLNSEYFIKIKPTIVNVIFSGILFIGLTKGKGLLRHLLGAAFQLTEEGWKLLSLRWACFFLFLAALNEVVWRSVPTETWVNFKVFGMLTLTILFTALQFPLIRKYRIDEKENDVMPSS